MEKLQAEIAGLRAELHSLKDIRDDLRNVASLSHSFSSMTESYDDIRFVSVCVSATTTCQFSLTALNTLLKTLFLHAVAGCERSTIRRCRMSSRFCRQACVASLLELTVRCHVAAMLPQAPAGPHCKC